MIGLVSVKTQILIDQKGVIYLKDLFGKGSLGYWLGSFAMILPLLFLVMAVPSFNYYSVLVVWIVSQISFLESIRLLTQKYEKKIKDLEITIDSNS